MFRTRPLRRHLAVSGLVAVMLAGCAADAPLSPFEPSATAPSSSSVEPTSGGSPAATRTPIPSPTPLAGLPAELVGSWETDLRDYLDEGEYCSPCGPEVRFTIGADGSWRVVRSGGQASGTFTIDDGRLLFGPSSVCSGTGTYEWQTGDDTLMLTAVERDGCPRRQEALDGPTYTRGE